MDYKTKFPVGAKVRMKAAAVEAYLVEIQRRVKGGRLGVVTGHSYPSEYPMVLLPKDGRKQTYNIGAIRAEDWEVVEVPQPNAQ